MANNPDAEAKKKELTEEEKQKARKQWEELLRKLAEQQGGAQPGSNVGPQPEPDIAGFTVTEDTARRQAADEAEKAAQGPQQQPHNEAFLHALARIYGVQPQSFEPDFAKVFIATSLDFSQQDQLIQGHFSSAGHDLPLVEVTKQHALTKGGQMTPELAMHLAMIAMSNPDMRKDGVEIKGKTEEDKLMLLAAAKAIGLTVKNEAEIKIDSEQQMQDRFQRCQQGRINLLQWAAAGPAAPAQRPQSPDGSKNSPDAADAAAAGATAEKLADAPDSKKPGADNKNPDDQAKPGKWADLSDKAKGNLREFFRAGTSRYDDVSDADLDKKIEGHWNGLDAKRQAALMDRAETAARQLKPGDEPAQTGAPVFEGLEGDDRHKKLVTEYVRSLHPEYDLTDEEWEKQAAVLWNGKSPEDRHKLLEEAITKAPELEAEAARRQAEAKNNADKPAATPVPAGDTGSTNKPKETTVEPASTKPGLTAPPAPTEPPAPQLAPMHERKYADLLPEEKSLLEADELAQRNSGKKKKATKLSEDAQKLLESDWDHAASNDNKSRVEKITGDLNNATAALIAEKARQAEQQRLLAEHAKALAKQIKDHEKAVKEFERAMAASDPDAPPEAPALKPVEKRSFEQLLPAEQRALRNLAAATRSDKDRKKAAEMWDDPALSPEARKERFDLAIAGEKNARLRSDIERERKKAIKALEEAHARAAAANAKPAEPTVVVNNADAAKSEPDAGGAAQKPVVVQPTNNPDTAASAQQTPPVVAAKEDGNTPVVKPSDSAPAATAPAGDQTGDKTPVKNDAAPADVKPAKGPRTYDQLSQAEHDVIWEFMTVTDPRYSANKDGSPFSKQQAARMWNSITTVAEQIRILDSMKQQNAAARDAVAKHKADRSQEHDALVNKKFADLPRAERLLLDEDFKRRKPDGVASAEAEWDAMDATHRSDRITLAMLVNPELGAYVQRARVRLANETMLVPQKFADLLPEEQKLLEADFDARKPDGVTSAQAEWDALDDRQQDRHMDKAMINNPELGEAIEPARDAANKAKLEAAKTPVVEITPTPAAKPRGKVRELVSSFLHAVFPWAFHDTPAPTAERKDPVLTLPEPPVDDKAGDAVIDPSKVPAASGPEIVAAAPGVEEASKKKFADLLEQEKKLLQVDHVARNGGAMLGAWEKEWDEAPDEAARAALFNQAWKNQPQMHERVTADQEAHKTPAVVQPPAPPKPAELAALNARTWDQLLPAEQDVIRAVEPNNANLASDWDNKWNAETRDEAYGVGILEHPELEAKVVEARQQAIQPVVAQTSPPAAPPAAKEAELLDIPPETDTEFDAALQAKGHSRADLAKMGIDQARDLIATIRREQEDAKKNAQQPPVEKAQVDPPHAADPPKQSMTSTFNITVEGIKTLPPSDEAIKVLSRHGFGDEKYQKAYQAIRAEVVEQQERCPGFHVSRKFLSQAANHAQLDEILGHKGLDPKEQNAMLECLRKEGVTTGKGPAVRDHNFGADNWDKNLATHYPSGPTNNPT